LKYEKFLFGNHSQSLTLPIAANKQDQCFTLRHLIINGTYLLDQLITILSYTPLLNHLSCQFLDGSVNIETNPTIVFSNITHISISSWRASFDQFELFIANYFPNLQGLRIVTYNNNTYLDAHRWEQLITRYMPHLRTFNFEYRDQIHDEDNVAFQARFSQFSSKFWHERKWFFTHNHCLNHNALKFIRFSTQTYKYKKVFF
jgi:hypothetical protein